MYERERGLQTLANHHLAVFIARSADFWDLHCLARLEPQWRATYDLGLG